MSRGLPTAIQAARAPSTVLPVLPSNMKVLFVGVDSVRSRNQIVSVGGTLTKSSPSMTFTTASGTPFAAADAGCYVKVSGCPSSANNGVFPATASPSSNQLTWRNAAGVAESAPSAVVEVCGHLSTVTDRVSGLVAPAASGNGLACDNYTEATGKIVWRTTQFATLETNEALDSGSILQNMSNGSMALYVNAARSTVASSVTLCAITNAANSQYVRAILTSSATNQTRMIRNNGSVDTLILASNAAINTLVRSSFTFSFDNSGGTSAEGFKDAVSLGAPVSTLNYHPTIDRFRLGSHTLSEETGPTRAFGLFNAAPSPADIAAVDAYVAAVYS